MIGTKLQLFCMIYNNNYIIFGDHKIIFLCCKKIKTNCWEIWKIVERIIYLIYHFKCLIQLTSLTNVVKSYAQLKLSTGT